MVQGAEQSTGFNLRWMIGVGVAGLALILFAVLLYLREEGPASLQDSFWQDLLLHLGAGLALSGVLFYFDKKFDKKFERARTDFAQALDEQLDQRLGKVLATQDRDDDAAARTFSSEGSFASLNALLTRATKLGTITKFGVRAAIPRTELYLRVSSPNGTSPASTIAPTGEGAAAAIDCFIEKADRVQVSAFRWASTDSTDEVFLQLHDLLAQAGAVVHPTRFLTDSAQLRDELANTLRIAIESRTGEAAGERTVARIYQRVADDWFVTTKGLEQLSSGHVVSVDQLHRKRVPQPPSFDGDLAQWNAIVDVARAAWRPNESIESFV